MKKESFQWELWKYCNNNCSFCILGKENMVKDKEKQLKSLNTLVKEIENLDFEKYDTISLIGGEFFQGQMNDKEVCDKFFEVIDIIFNLYVEKKITSIWVACILTAKDQTHLYRLLEKADKCGIKPTSRYDASGLWLCTSWDTKGRFHTEAMQKNWEYHMTNIAIKYPWVKTVINIILQQSFIDMYLNNKFSPRAFMARYNARRIFYNNCSLPNIYHMEYCKKFKGMSKKEIDEYLLQEKKAFNKKVGFDFFPTRDSFIKFLAKYYIEDKETFNDLYNDAFECDTKYKYDHNNVYDLNGDILNVVCESGHDSLIYSPYVDSTKCCLCDKERMQ